jgi:hypothetical protein
MPNWCSNNIRVSGPAAAIDEFAEWLDDGKNLLGKILPTPKELTEVQSPFNGTKEESDALIAKYGFNNWYDWNIHNWGTKWDVEADVQENDGEIGLMFESAWSPPQRAIALLAKKFDKLSFHHAYLEEGMCFVGYDDYEGGNLVKDFYSEDPDSDEWQEIARDEFGWEPMEDDEDDEDEVVADVTK